jgi:hypothetical protein
MGFELSAFARKAANGVRLRKVERKVLQTFAPEATESMWLAAAREPDPRPPSIACEYPTRSIRRASGFVQTPIWRVTERVQSLGTGRLLVTVSGAQLPFTMPAG